MVPRITSIEVVPYALPFREPYVTANGSLRHREMALLRLRSADGPIGLGEAVPLSLRGGATLEQVVGELLGLEGAGDADALAGAAERLSAPSRCAVATALTDLAGRLGEERAAPELRSVIAPGPVRCNATLVAGEADAVAADALRWAEAGFSAFKLKLGEGPDAKSEIARVRAVREAVGPEASIRVDANGAWDARTAKRVLKKLEPLDVELAEQPVATPAAMAEVASATSIPLAADETLATAEEAQRARAAGQCSLAALKLSKVGGPGTALEIAAAIPSYMSSALDGPVGIAAAAYTVQAMRDLGHDGAELAHGLATQRLFATTIATSQPMLHGDMLHLPDGPGLGVEIDEKALAAHRL